MDISTISGMYENSRKILRLLDHPHLDQQLKMVASDPELTKQLAVTLSALRDHTRVLGLEKIWTIDTKVSK